MGFVEKRPLKGLLIRIATEDDVYEIAKLDKLIFPSCTVFLEDVVETLLEFLFLQRSYVATIDERIVGYAIINTGTVLGVSAAELASFGVDPELQGRGIGSLLLEMVIAECVGYEVELIKLHVNVENRAVRLYHSMGFRFVKTEPDYYEDSVEKGVSHGWLGEQSRDAYLMCKRFGRQEDKRFEKED